MDIQSRLWINLELWILKKLYFLVHMPLENRKSTVTLIGAEGQSLHGLREIWL